MMAEIKLKKDLNEEPAEMVNLSEMLSDLDGIIEVDDETDAIELRDLARERGL